MRALVSIPVFLCSAGLAGAEPLAIGAAVPPAVAGVTMENLDGSRLAINDIRGSAGTLVVFSCNHCPYVVAWEERMASLFNGASEQGIGVIVINSNDSEKYPADSLPKMRDRAKERGFEFPYVVDATSEVARAFGATRTPEVFLFDDAGKLSYHGAIDDNSEDPLGVKEHYLRDAMHALIAGEKVKTKQTKAIGCTIKFRPKAG
jgi:peroxiredoxin